MHYKEYKTLLSSKNNINVYRGCLHGCIYCDSRSLCYKMEHEFEDIEIKKDAAAILELELQHRRKPFMISTGAMCDPYIPIEEDLRITRRCLEIIEKHGFGLTILTKSTRILRDLDLLKAINAKSKCVVQVTLTTFDEDLCRKIEPNVSTTRERFHVLEVMRDAGIPTFVWFTPLLPFINDTEKNLRGILNYCIEAKVRGIMFYGIGVTLREGNREYFYDGLDRLFPGLKRKYIMKYGSAYSCNSPHNMRFTKIFNETCEKHGILYKSKDVWGYLKAFEANDKQLSLFDL